MSAVEVVPLAPGAFHLRGYLSPSEQRRVAAMVQALADGPVGFYRPRVRGGGFMHCDMLCLGRHWNARTYTYERQRSDHDGRPAPPLPPELARPAVEAAARVGFALDPDICLVNRYGEGGRMGLHQDKDEDASTLDAGVPVVSLSLGETGRFLLGGFRRWESTTTIELRSGDAFVMGGPSRLRYHGVARILRGSAPPALDLLGRISLTFRQYALEAHDL
ncbi:MAG: alpha-ketoglutarate-dependent dioxygenase AlkB [Acidobacteria bacterium]|nr:alpha-ketoglutarate-dependent dioxygenase AlkB [Acidobacteriota bacterium]